MTPEELTSEQFEGWLENKRDYFSKKSIHYTEEKMGSAAYEAKLIERTFSDVLRKYRSILPPPTTLN